jgi:DNA-binding HxlR family transcriptional regulator
VLNVRLGELRDAGLVAHAPGDGYVLTDHGRDLMRAARPLLEWAPRWAEALGQGRR